MGSSWSPYLRIRMQGDHFFFGVVCLFFFFFHVIEQLKFACKLPSSSLGWVSLVTFSQVCALSTHCGARSQWFLEVVTRESLFFPVCPTVQVGFSCSVSFKLPISFKLPRVSALVAVAWFSLVGRETYQVFLFQLPQEILGAFQSAEWILWSEEHGMVWVRQPLEIIWSNFTVVAGTDLIKCCCRGSKTHDIITKICTVFTLPMWCLMIASL